MWTVRTRKEGSEILMKKYMATIVKKLIVEKEPKNSKFFYDHCIETLGERSVSRASVIFYLNDLVEWNYAKFDTTTGKGGHHRRYWTDLTVEQFKDKILQDIIESSTDSIVEIFKE